MATLGNGADVEEVMDASAAEEAAAATNGDAKKRRKKKKKKVLRPSASTEAEVGREAEPAADGFEDVSGDGGLRKKVTLAGQGETPSAGAYVRAHYVGSLDDGEVFDSSRAKNKEFVFQLGEGQVIRGWDEGFAAMRVGEQAVLKLAPEYGYGATGAGNGAIPPHANLTFEVELLGFYATQCATTGCKREATMQCPKCTALGLPPSYFCSQDCFKEFWPQHKRIHKRAQRSQRDDVMPPEFRFYSNWSGTLRPWARSPMREVPEHIPRPDYAADGTPYSEKQDKRGNRRVYEHNAEEIEKMREACCVGREILDAAGQAVAVGVTCDEIDRVVHEATVERGGYPSPLNYYNFPKSVCTSVNEVICHGIPDKRPLADGDIINIDVSVFIGGFHADLNETFLVGEVDEEGRKLVQCAFECLKAAVDICRPGVDYCDLGATISRRAKQSQCSVVTSYCGHGIGRLFHTSPNVPHYARNKAKGTMRPGHIFTIEPMINLGRPEDHTWPDNWTAVARDGSRSAQFEHTLLITETGVDILTMRDNEPIMEWSEEKVQRH